MLILEQLGLTDLLARKAQVVYYWQEAALETELFSKLDESLGLRVSEC